MDIIGVVPMCTSLQQSVRLVAGVAGHAHKHYSADFTARAIFVRSLALIMLLSSIAMALYATYNFRLRSSMLQ